MHITEKLSHPYNRKPHLCYRKIVHTLAGITAVAWLFPLQAYADPTDGMTHLNELARRAEQTSEEIHAAEVELEQKHAEETAAEQRHIADLQALQQAQEELTNYHASVNHYAATRYMNGIQGDTEALLLVDSPQQLIDRMTLQQQVAQQVARQIHQYSDTLLAAQQTERDSQKAAEQAHQIAQQLEEAHKDLENKQHQLHAQIETVQSQYRALSAQQREELSQPTINTENTDTEPDTAEEPQNNPLNIATFADDIFEPDSETRPADIAIHAALTQLGTPYAYGGAEPGGFDCSGLVMWAFRQAGINLPHSSRAQAAGGTPVALSDLQPGDVLTFYSDASHSGIYIGDGMMVHSSTYGQPVQVAPINASGPIHNARRY